jgi:hypothetical protein
VQGINVDVNPSVLIGQPDVLMLRRIRVWRVPVINRTKAEQS